MIFSFIIYLVLFLGGIWMMGIAHELPDYQALVFCGGLIAFTLAVAFMMRERGSATRRSKNWSGKAAE